MNIRVNKTKTDNLIFIIFFLSGISGLIYETVWLRMLSRILGSTVYATSIIIAAFMLGLTLGSYIIGKHADTIRNLIRLYALLEIGIAFTALSVFLLFNKLVPVYQFFYHIADNNRILYMFLQATLLFLLLVIPTFLMGGTLPLLSSEIKKYNPNFSLQMGKLYGLNTLGASVGVVMSGFFTIGYIGELNTVMIGVILNLSVGVIALFILGRNIAETVSSPLKERTDLSANSKENISAGGRTAILFIYFIIGFTAFAFEVVWTRLFQLRVGTSIYSFSMVLSIYLLGSALGSIIGGRYYTRSKDPFRILGFSLLFIGLYSITGIYLFCIYNPEGILAALHLPQMIIVPLLVVFPITFMLGFIFPVVTHSYVEHPEKTGSGVGRLYAMNTMGCIIGSLICGYILIRTIGTRGTIVFLSCINGLTGLIVLFLNLEKAVTKSNAIALTLFSLILLLGFLSPDPFFTVVKRVAENDIPDMKIYYHKEGIAATTTAYGSVKDPLNKRLLVNGIGMTSLVPETKIMAHLPILLHHDPHDMLIICFGMGTCIRSASDYSEINCSVVELVGEEYETYKYFHQDGPQVLARKNVSFYTDDGRNFLLMKNKNYDIITIDPAPPIASAGTVNLYTADFFELCKSHLNKNGIMCLWIPPSPYSEVKMIMKTYQYVFPNTDLYGGVCYPGFFMIGYADDTTIDKNRFLSAGNRANIMADLNEWGTLFKTPEKLLDLKILNPSTLKMFLENTEVISDNYPYTEFPMWRRVFNKEYHVEFNANMLKEILKKETIIH